MSSSDNICIPQERLKSSRGMKKSIPWDENFQLTGWIFLSHGTKSSVSRDKYDREIIYELWRIRFMNSSRVFA